MAAKNMQLRDMQELATCAICLELFTDARSLSYSHCFCLACLLQVQKTEQLMSCPKCRQNTLPARSALRGLEPNGAVNDLVALLYRQGYSSSQETETKSIPKSTDSQPAADNNIGGPENLRRLQNLLRSGSNASPPSTAGTATQRKPKSPELPQPKCQAESDDEPNLGDMLGDLLLHGLLLHALESDSNNHKGIECDHCGKSNFTGARFKCGICPDYDLCSACEGKPRHEVHNRLHFFIKLKIPQRKHVPKENVLLPVALAMGRSMDFNRNAHSREIRLEPLSVTMVYVCDKCGTKPILGVRYKCSVCDDYNLCSSCEHNSLDIHERSHPFVKIPHPCSMGADRLLRFSFY